MPANKRHNTRMHEIHQKKARQSNKEQFSGIREMVISFVDYQDVLNMVEDAEMNNKPPNLKCFISYYVFQWTKIV